MNSSKNLFTSQLQTISAPTTVERDDTEIQDGQEDYGDHVPQTVRKVVLKTTSEPVMIMVSSIFIKWEGMDIIHKDTDQKIRVPWTVQRLRGTSIFSCTCDVFKQNAMKGTFVYDENGRFTFSQDDQFDQLNRAYNFRSHLHNKRSGYNYCDHVSKVIVSMCSSQDAAFDSAGLLTQKK